MAFTKKPAGARGRGKPSFYGRKRKPMKKKRCRFCVDKVDVDYKNINLLKTFVTERGKILSGRITGTCPRHQRLLTVAVKRARMLALLPFAVV
jgi:small subunit ribosomal protein S18